MDDGIGNVNQSAQDKLRALRHRLAELEPYPWEPVETWIASAHPLIKAHTSPLTQGQHRAIVKGAQKALLDDEDRLDPVIYEALNQFLIWVRKIDVVGRSIYDIQAIMLGALETVLPQQGTTQPLPQGLAVLGALGMHPAATEVVRMLLGA